MALPELSERAVRIAVILFSVSGLVVLSMISAVTEVERIHVDEAIEHDGERVRIEAMVIGSASSRSGSAWLMVIEENNTLEIFMESGKADLDPGSKITAEGDITTIDGEPVLTVQKDKDILTLERTEAEGLGSGAGPGDVRFFMGIVQSSHRIGWDDLEVVIIPIKEGSISERPVLLEMKRVETDLRPGDVMNVTVLFTSEDTGLTYGDRAYVVMARSDPVTLSLLRLVEDMRLSPSAAPLSPITVEGFLRYPVSGRTMYISEMAEGGEISVRVRAIDARSDLERGDLVRLVNCSLSWDSEGMRFELAPASVELLDVHGPWVLNLGSMEGGLMDFIDCRVEVSGYIEGMENTTRITEGEGSIELRNYTGPIGSGYAGVRGRVIYDGLLNFLYLDVEEFWF